MPALKNQRHEKFVLALFEGKSATQAYAEAGYKPCRQNAARLTTKDDIRARLAELQNQVAEDTTVTVESLLRELEMARSQASDNNQLGAATQAIMGKAKLAGLLKDKIEIGPADAFSEAESYADVADGIIEGLVAMYRPVTDEDRDGLIEFIERQASELAEYVAALKARPINGHAENPAEANWSAFKTRRAEFDQQREQPRLGRR